jgi:AAA domain, putative AbiEii toxin, Type IV TA system
MKLPSPVNYGEMPQGRVIDIPDTGYAALIGTNNSGKSTMLQLLYKVFMETSEIGNEKVAFLPPERSYVQPSTETGNRSLSDWNGNYYPNLANQPLTYESHKGPDSLAFELMRVLLNHTAFLKQNSKLQQYLAELGFSSYDLARSQYMVFPNGRIDTQGTGLRSLICILAALTDESLEVILIDEPELYLEPTVQKALRDLLIREANGRKIFVTTHSHLFIERDTPSQNILIRLDENQEIQPRRLNTAEELYDLVFTLLGNDTSDLFFPNNYLVVEGVSDQIICEGILKLEDSSGKSQVKILAAGGITRIKNKLAAVEDSLTPLVMRGSPYRERTVALIDKPNEGDEQNKVNDLKKYLGDRFFTLTSGCIEEYLPEDLYTKAGRSKQNDLEELERLKGDFGKLSQCKQNISIDIAAHLTADDLKTIPILQDSVKKALSFQ